MSRTTIQQTFKIGNTPTDMTSVVFRNADGTIGLQRTDTAANVIAPGTALNHPATGTYSYTFDDPAAGLTYNYWIEFVTPAGNTLRYNRLAYAAAPGVLLPTYLASSEADTLAAALPGLSSYKAASDADKSAALALATSDIDRGMRYQGRKFDPTQTLEFPRVAFDAPNRVWNVEWIDFPVILPNCGAVVWDWDSDNNVAIVPQNVKLACVYQADSILTGNREERLSEQHDGVVQASNSGMQETYRQRNQAPGLDTGLCRRAYLLLQRYRLATGRIV